MVSVAVMRVAEQENETLRARIRVLEEVARSWKARATDAEAAVGVLQGADDARIKELEGKVEALKDERNRNLEYSYTRIKELEEALAVERYAREQIEQRCDPAGDTRELILLRDENRQLRALAGEVSSG